MRGRSRVWAGVAGAAGVVAGCQLIAGVQDAVPYPTDAGAGGKAGAEHRRGEHRQGRRGEHRHRQGRRGEHRHRQGRRGRCERDVQAAERLSGGPRDLHDERLRGRSLRRRGCAVGCDVLTRRCRARVLRRQRCVHVHAEDLRRAGADVRRRARRVRRDARLQRRHEGREGNGCRLRRTGLSYMHPRRHLRCRQRLHDGALFGRRLLHFRMHPNVLEVQPRRRRWDMRAPPVPQQRCYLFESRRQGMRWYGELQGRQGREVHQQCPVLQSDMR